VSGPSKYVILERLAVGGMGEVFLARQEGIGGFARAVVLKKLLPDIQQEDDATKRFLDEARIAAALQHPNVVAIIEVGEGEREGDSPYLALEYVHGENVAALRNKAKKAQLRVPVVVAARIVCDAALGLQHAHDAKDAQGRALNIVHRDVSPKNVFVRVDGSSKIGDFGIARADHRLSKTATGAVPGTLSYMSPEQAAAKAMGPESDQFSLGIVLWELLATQRLFKAESAIETIRMLLTMRIDAPSAHRPDARVLDAVVMRMLHRDPLRRFPSLGAAVEALRAAIPECEGETGQLAVAAFVEALAGNDLRERMARIENPSTAFVPNGESTEVVRDRKGSGSNDVTTAQRKRAGSAAALTPPTPEVRDIHATATRARDFDSTVRDTVVPVRKRSRAPLVAAAMIGALALAGGAGAAAMLRPPTHEERQRAFLRDALVRNPFVQRHVFLANAQLDEIDPEVAQKTADALAVLVDKRLQLLAAHWAKPEEQRERDRIALEKQERALENEAKQVLTALEHPELEEEALDNWAYDASVPDKWLEPEDLVTLQAEMRTGVIENLEAQKELKAIAVPSMVKRACADADATLAQLAPLVEARDALVVKFSQAPVADLERIDHDMDVAEARVQAHLAAACGPALGPAVASIALHFISDFEEVEPLYSIAPSVREAKKGIVLAR
jgi:serine/threonine protein kinase